MVVCKCTEFMTNLLAQITISLSLITNWTGHVFEGKEVGYVATNHVATVLYQDVTNQYTLKTTVSEIAVWRKAEPRQYLTVTNGWNYVFPLTMTNIYFN